MNAELIKEVEASSNSSGRLVQLVKRKSLQDYWDYDWKKCKKELHIETVELEVPENARYLLETNIAQVVDSIYEDKYTYCSYSRKKFCNPIILECPTNAGKTTFAIQHLAQKAKSEGKLLLILANREALALQMREAVIKAGFDKKLKNEMKSYDNDKAKMVFLKHCGDQIGNVIVMTYQSYVHKHDEVDPSNVGIVVADECHYFVSDSTFNDATDKALSLITRNFSKSLRIYMSATIEEVAPVIATYEAQEQMQKMWCHNAGDDDCFACEDRLYCHKFVVYHIPYKGIQKNIRCKLLKSSKEKDMFEEIETICKSSGDKSIIFVDSIKTGQSLCAKLNGNTEAKDAIEVLGAMYGMPTKKTRFAEFVDASSKGQDVFEYIVCNASFECDVLITTNVLDNGVNLNDDKIKNIFILSLDPVTNIQSLGRKRFNGNEKVTVYMRNYKGGDIANKLYNVQNNMRELETIDEDIEGYVLQSAKDKTNNLINIVRRSKDGFEYNRLAYVKFKYTETFLQGLLDEIDDNPDVCVDRMLKWYRGGIDKKYMGYYRPEIQFYKYMESICTPVFCANDKQLFLEDFRNRYMELGLKDETDRKDRADKPYTVTRANGKLERLGLPFVIDELEDRLYVRKTNCLEEDLRQEG